MPNLTAARGTETAHFTNGVLREIVVQQEATFDFAFLQVVDELLVFLRAESCRHKRLRLTACEQRRSVHAGQPANLSRDWTNLGKSPPIRTPSFIENVVAEDGLFEVIEDQFGHRALFRLIFRVRLDDLFLQGI